MQTSLIVGIGWDREQELDRIEKSMKPKSTQRSRDVFGYVNITFFGIFGMAKSQGCKTSSVLSDGINWGALSKETVDLDRHSPKD